MNRRDKTKGGAPGRHPEHRQRSQVAATATIITAPIVTGELRRARGDAWNLVVPKCPYCSARHVHGAPDGLQTREERHLSHCVGGGASRTGSGWEATGDRAL